MRIVYVLNHPIQYQTPMIKHLMENGLDLEVVYLTDITAKGYRDSGFGGDVVWDVSLVGDYPCHVLYPGGDLRSRWGCGAAIFQNLVKLYRRLRAEVVWVHGWGSPYCIAALAAARRCGIPIVLRGETYSDRHSGWGARRCLHRFALRKIFGQVSRFLSVGTANREYYIEHGVSPSNIDLVPYAVDNAFFQKFRNVDCQIQARMREDLAVTPAQPIVLYCGKLSKVKDPATLVNAISRLVEFDPVLVFVGDGQLRGSLEVLASASAKGRVRFLGFRNQSELPLLYSLCDVFVLPSMFEPWGLVVNEVMNLGKPVVVSDRVGAGFDLVRRGVNGSVFEAGNVESLCLEMSKWLGDSEKRRLAGESSLEIINGWGYEQCVDGVMKALCRLREANCS